MKKSILLLSVIGTTFFVGCARHGSNDSITCINRQEIEEEKYLSSVFKNSKIIRLETTEESLIGHRINKIKKVNGNYFISYNDLALVVFDNQGKFLYKIQREGNGPGEYIMLQDFDILPSGNIVITDSRKLLFYSSTGEFIKTVPMDIICFNLKAIDEDNFLIRASRADYIVYLINAKGDILSKQLERNDLTVLGRGVSFYALDNDRILYQREVTNDFLLYNTKRKDFININLLCDEDHILSIETVNKHKKMDQRFDGLSYADENPSVKAINGIALSDDHLLFFVGQPPSGYKCYIMNTSTNKIISLLTEITTDDICFTRNLFAPLLYSTRISDNNECLIAYVWPYQIIDGLNENIKLNEHPNYQRLRSLFKDTQDIENENPVLIELRR